MERGVECTAHEPKRAELSLPISFGECLFKQVMRCHRPRVPARPTRVMPCKPCASGATQRLCEELYSQISYLAQHLQQHEC